MKIMVNQSIVYQLSLKDGFYQHANISFGMEIAKVVKSLANLFTTRKDDGLNPGLRGS